MMSKLCNDDFDVFCENYTPNPDAHSSWAFKEKKSGKIYSNSGAICYANLKSIESTISRLKVFFGEEKVKEADHPETYLEWYINRSFFADAFLTKDVQEGFDKGFEVDCTKTCRFIYAALCGVRQSVEISSPYDYLLKQGYSHDQALSFSCAFCFTEKGKKLLAIDRRQGHVLFPLSGKVIFKDKGKSPMKRSFGLHDYCDLSDLLENKHSFTAGGLITQVKDYLKVVYTKGWCDEGYYGSFKTKNTPKNIEIIMEKLVNGVLKCAD